MKASAQHTAIQCCGSGMFIPVRIFPSRIQGLKDSEYRIRIHIICVHVHPGSGFFPHPGSRVKKAPDLDPQHCRHIIRNKLDIFEMLVSRPRLASPFLTIHRWDASAQLVISPGTVPVPRNLRSVLDPWHFGTEPDPRIHSGSCSFRQWLSRCHLKLGFF